MYSLFHFILFPSLFAFNYPPETVHSLSGGCSGKRVLMAQGFKGIKLQRSCMKHTRTSLIVCEIYSSFGCFRPFSAPRPLLSCVNCTSPLPTPLERYSREVRSDLSISTREISVISRFSAIRGGPLPQKCAFREKSCI